MIEAKEVKSVVIIDSLYYIDGDHVAETRIMPNDYKAYEKMPRAISIVTEKDGPRIFTRTGWNSDTGTVCYKTGATIGIPE